MKKLSVFLVSVFVLGLVITGCSDVGFSGGADNNKPVLGDGPGASVTEEVAKEADAFSSKLSIQKGIGDFEITAYKQPEGLGHFVIRTKNVNSFPASAMVLSLFKKQDGEIVATGCVNTPVLLSGAEDIHAVDIEESLLKNGYDLVEITAYATNKTPNTVRMIDNFPSSKVSVADGGIVKGGSSDGWHQVDIMVGSSADKIGDAHALFFDESGYLIRYSPVWARDKTFKAYNPESYDHVEIIVEKLVEDVPELPQSVYDEYRNAGYLSEVDGSTTYKSPEGSVEYCFFKAADGSIVMRANNLTDQRVRWYVNNSIVFSGNRTMDTMYLYLEPGEEIWWDLGFDKDSEFCLLNPVATNAEKEKLKAPMISVSDADGARTITADASATMKSINFEEDNTVYCSATVIYYQGENIVASEHVTFDYEMIYYQKQDTRYLNYDGEFDSYKIYEQFEQNHFSIQGY